MSETKIPSSPRRQRNPIDLTTYGLVRRSAARLTEVTVEGKKVKMNDYQLWAIRTVEAALKGDVRARREIFSTGRILAELEVFLSAAHLTGVIVVPKDTTVEDWVAKYARPVFDESDQAAADPR